MCLSGERIPTQDTDTSVYPFEHAVTLKLSPDSAARVGQEIITVSESEILQDCELPKATELPTETQIEPEPARTPNQQLTLFGDTTPDTTPDQLTLFYE